MESFQLIFGYDGMVPTGFFGLSYMVYHPYCKLPGPRRDKKQSAFRCCHLNLTLGVEHARLEGRRICENEFFIQMFVGMSCFCVVFIHGMLG